MVRRIPIIFTLVTALGAGVVIAGNATQKDKAKTKDQVESKEQKEKDKEAKVGPGLHGLLAFEPGGEGGYLGVYLEEVTPERTKELGLKEERGAVVMKVVAGSPAEKAGLKENDVVVSFNGRRVDSVREMQRLLNETPADRTVQIEVMRGGSKQTLTAILAKRSIESYRLFSGDAGRFRLQNEEEMKRLEKSLKQSQEAWKRSQEELKEKMKVMPRDFGDFAFVSPGEFSLFRGSRLGIGAESLTDQLAEFFGVKESKGALVVSVEENSAAAKAGLKAGDVIIAVGDDKVDSVRALVKALSGKEEGTVPVKIVRNHVEQTLNVTLEKRERPATRRRAFSYTTRSSAV